MAGCFEGNAPQGTHLSILRNAAPRDLSCALLPDQSAPRYVCNMVRMVLMPLVLFWLNAGAQSVGPASANPVKADSTGKLEFILNPASAGLIFSQEQGENRARTDLHFRGAFSARVHRRKGRGHLTMDAYQGEGLPMLRAMEAGFDRRHGQGKLATRMRGRWDAQVLPSVGLSLGRDTLHDGWGRRSLFRGRHVAPVSFLQTVIDGGGRLRYRHRIETLQGAPSMFCSSAELGDPRFWTPPTGAIRGKIERMVVSHRLEVDFSPRLTGALWGAVVWNVRGGNRIFEPHYLLPLTSLRPTEYAQGSEDNALVGMEGRFQLGDLKGPEKYLYGQILLDELIVSEILGSTGWWGNKYALLGGVCWSYPQGGWRLEMSGARPWTYSHFTPTSAYIHGLTPLAHPLGANFLEASAQGQWKKDGWQLYGRLTASTRGDDPSGDAPTGSLPQVGDIDRLQDTFGWLNGTARAFLLAQLDLSHKVGFGANDHMRVFVRSEFQSIQTAEERTRFLRLTVGLRSTAPWFGADW